MFKIAIAGILPVDHAVWDTVRRLLKQIQESITSSHDQRQDPFRQNNGKGHIEQNVGLKSVDQHNSQDTGSFWFLISPLYRPYAPYYVKVM